LAVVWLLIVLAFVLAVFGPAVTAKVIVGLLLVALAGVVFAWAARR
jgi:hypothetical protein